MWSVIVHLFAVIGAGVSVAVALAMLDYFVLQHIRAYLWNRKNLARSNKRPASRKNTDLPTNPSPLLQTDSLSTARWLLRSRKGEPFMRQPPNPPKRSD